MKYDRNEILAGIFVLICILLLLGLIFKAGNFRESMQPKKEIIVKFSHARGMKLNSPVYYAGVNAGKVSKIEIDKDDNVYLTLQLDKSINIRKDSEIKIAASVMGETYVDITPGKGKIIQQGETVEGIDASLAQQIENVVNSISELVESKQITSSLDNLDKTLKNIADVSETIANDRDKIDAIISNIENMTDEEQVQKIDEITGNVVEITDTVEDILEENRKSIREITRNIETITDNLYILSADLKRHPWKIIRKSREEDVEQYALKDAIIRLREAQRNLEILQEKDEKISEEDLEEIRTLIQNLQTIKESRQELITSGETEKEKELRRKPFEKPLLGR
jgi:phospholipid/cholesterol/gamma-HCH transport system substrate-binding protein